MPGDACGYLMRPYQTGAVLTTTEYWIGAGCSPIVVPPGLQLVELGPEVDPSEFVRVTRE